MSSATGGSKENILKFLLKFGLITWEQLKAFEVDVGNVDRPDIEHDIVKALIRLAGL